MSMNPLVDTTSNTEERVGESIDGRIWSRIFVTRMERLIQISLFFRRRHFYLLDCLISLSVSHSEVARLLAIEVGALNFHYLFSLYITRC